MSVASTPVDLLRFVTAGSVDDGKSTLIGRLLYDSKSLFENQIDALTADGESLQFANLTDGLKAERDQGITIDVAYRYFSTPRRRFIIADSPGHVQYTRNMVTAASTAQVSLILIDATKGITEQTRRHTYISSLLGIHDLFVCINKMDLVGYSKETFEKIRDEFTALSKPLALRRVQFIPISALNGDNVVEPSEKLNWYTDSPLLESLETHQIFPQDDIGARFAVQWIIKQDRDNPEKGHFRGYAGQMVGGTFSVGDEVIVLPSNKRTRIRQILADGKPISSASPPMPVTVLLEHDLDIGRGEVIVPTSHAQPGVTQQFSATVCWMSDEPLQQGRAYLLKNYATTVKVKATSLSSKLDINTLQRTDNIEHTLMLNEIGRVDFQASEPLVLDPYQSSRTTGGFIIIDADKNTTVGAGLIETVG